jgi:hypothetical protein
MADRPLIFDSTELGIARASDDIIIPGSLELNNGGTDIGLVFGGGSTASLSPASQGTIRYNESTQKFQVSVNGGSFTDIAVGSTSISIGDTIVSGTAGSVLFLGTSNVLAQNNSKLFWDNSAFRLGIGNATPAQALHVTGTGRFSTSIIVDSLTAGRVPYVGASGLISDISTLTFNSGTGALTATAFFGANITDSALTSGRVVLAGTSGLLQDDSTLTYSAGTLSATALQATSLTSGRVPIVSTAGLIVDDATLTFAAGLLTATNLKATALTPGRVTFATTGGQLTDSSTLTFSAGTLTATGLVASSVTDSGLTSGRITFASTGGLLADASTLTFNSGTGVLSATGVSVTSLTSSALTSGRVVLAGTSGLLQDDATLTFSGGTLSATNLKATGLTSGRIPFVGTGGLLGDDASLTYSTVTGQNILLTDAATATVTDLLTLDHRSSGTSASGYGTGILFRGQDGSSTVGGDDIARISGTLTTVTSGSEVSSLLFQTRTAGGALATALTVTSATTSAAVLATTSSFNFNANSMVITGAGSTVTHTLGNSRTQYLYSRTAPVSGALGFLSYTPGSSTGRTLSTEINEFSYTSGSKQWATGAITTQREILFSAPTYSFVGASTITTAATIAISGAPIAGSNATLTSSYSLWTQDGQVQFDIQDSTAATQLSVLGLSRKTSATAAAGIGSSIDFTAPSDSGVQVAAGRIIGGLRSTTGTGAGVLVLQYGTSNAYSTAGWLASGIMYGATLGIGTLTLATLTTTTSATIGITSSMVTYLSNSSSQGGHSFTGVVNTSGARQFFTITPSANTGGTLSTEIKKFEYAAYTQTWATGAITTQREAVWNAPTYAFVGASVITEAATLAITGAPIAGTNATITNAYSLWTQNGTVKHDLTDSVTNAATDILILDHRSSGTVAANFGTGLLFRGQDASGTAGGDDIGRISFTLATATSGSEVSRFNVQTRSAGAALANLMSLDSTNASFQSGVFALGNASVSIGITTPTSACTFTLAQSRFAYVYTRTAPTSGSTGFYVLTPGSDTGRTASTEISNFVYTATSRQWSTGALSIQREIIWNAPTFGFAGASTLTTSMTMAVTSAPVAGTNATITNSMVARFGGDVALGPTSAGMTYTGIEIPASTLTVSGTTQVTSAVGVSALRLDIQTVTNASASTIDQAATLDIVGVPVATGSAVITDAVAILARAGNLRLNSGSINLGSTVGSPGIKLRIEAASASAGIELGDAATLAVSPSNTGRIRYISSTQKFQTSVNGGAWTDFGSGAGGSMSIGGAVTGATDGSVLFVGASATLGQDNANFFWDDTNNRLGIGNATPAQALHVTGSGRFSTSVIVDGLTSTRVLFAGAAGVISDSASLTYVSGTGVLTATGLVASSITDSGLTSGRVAFASTGGLLADASTLTFNSGTGELSATSLVATGLTSGSIVFSASGVLTQDNSNLFWDDANNRLGIRTNTSLTAALELGGTSPDIYLNGGTSNTIRFNGTGSGAPTFTTSSVGTKILLAPDIAANRADFAIGVESGHIWQSVSQATSFYGYKWYGGTTLMMHLTGDGILELPSTNTILALTDSGSKVGIRTTTAPTGVLELGGTSPDLFMNGATSNKIRFNGNGVAAPTFTTSSAGTKILLAPDIAVNRADFALGVEAQAIWFSVSQATSSYNYKWYGGTTELFRITADGSIELPGSSAAVSSVNAGRLRYNSGTQNFEVSNNGGAYAAIGSGGTMSIGGTVTSGTTGSVLFIGGSAALTQDNANFFWDDTNNRLGIGNAAPAQALHVTGTGRFSTSVIVDGLTATRVLFAGASGLISDSASLTYNSGTGALTATSLALAGKITGLTQGTASGEAIHAARSIATSTGLTGGGDLTADRTLSVDQSTAFAWTNNQTWAVGSGTQTMTITDATTTTQLDLLNLRRGSSGTAAAGNGVNLVFSAQDAAGTIAPVSRIQGIARTVTAGSLNGAMVFQYANNGTLTNTAWIVSGVFGCSSLQIGSISATGSGSAVFSLQSTGNMILYTNNNTSNGGHSFSGSVNTTGARQFFLITPSANTGSTLSTEIKKFEYAAYTNTWATGAITTQREVVWNAPTYAFAGSSTITDAATVAITGAPIAGTNATITNAYSLWTQNGLIRHDLADSATNTVTDLMILNHTSSGTAAAGYGTGILFRGQDASATAGGDDLGRISATLTTATSGSEVSAMQLQVRTAGGALATALTVAPTLVTGAGTLVATSIGITGNNLIISTSANTITHTLANSRFSHVYNRTAPASGSDKYVVYNLGNSTNRTLSTEIPEFDFAVGSKQWATGAITTQREFLIRQPTYSFVGASTITTAATFAVVGAPVAGSNATLTSSYALWVQADTTRLDGLLDLSGIAAGSPNIKITATSDTPATTFNATNGTNAAPAGYIEISVGGASKYIPFYS